MKRSEINQIIRNSKEFLDQCHFYLPQFAYWTIQDWKNNDGNHQEIIKNHLGWDITDYGSEEFHKIGLMHFTIRNGRYEDIPDGGKNYCEKIMIIEDGQEGPMHFHYKKMEDIINRGGGFLMIRLYLADENKELSQEAFKVSIDGISKVLEPGTIIELKPGESITLPPYMFHKFWSKKGHGAVLVGEVSSVNDDYGDNFYIDHVGRFAEIEEDVTPIHLLVSDYDKLNQF